MPCDASVPSPAAADAPGVASASAPSGSVIAVILAGGAGTRLWPVSREDEPKQVARGLGAPSLLQRTAARLRGCLGGDAAPMLVVCGAAHAAMAAAQLCEAGADSARLLLEPVRRNTAAALTAAALHVAQQAGDPVLVAAPADHMVADAQAFGDSLAHACALAREGRVVALGVVPDRAETGYGYIELGEPLDADGAHAMRAFREKPDAATAAACVADGRHWWNSGIFVLRASVWLALIQRYEPEVYAACVAAAPRGPDAHGWLRLQAEPYARAPARSIDYAVMEHLPRRAPGIAAAVPLCAPWSDLGSWEALWQTGRHDARRNACHGRVVLEDVSGSLVHAQARLVACLGVRDLVVVETAQAVLVAERSRSQELGRLVQRLEHEGPAGTTRRPWGRYEVLHDGASYRVKRLVVEPGQCLSLQRHAHRAEHWVVLAGQARVTLGERRFALQAGGSASIPVGMLHRLANTGEGPLEVLEIQMGERCDEDDIERVEDAYGRCG